jgi:hypothetical protein
MPDASYASVETLAKRAEKSTPLGRHMAIRAAAYAADYVGSPPEKALGILLRAERLAERVNQRMDIAIARYQRGIRIGGSEGEGLIASARALMQEAGAHPLLLEEDVARR